MRHVPLLILLVVSLAGARPYYLNTGLTAGGDGSGAAPWNSVDSINAAGRSFNPGDSILIASGTIVKTDNPARRAARPYYLFPSDTFRGVLSPRGSGNAAGGRIVIDTFIADPTRTALPIIDAQGVNMSAGILLYNQQYWTISNMEVKNMVSFNRGPRFADSVLKQGWRWGIFVYCDGNGVKNETFGNISICNNTVDAVYSTFCRSPKTGYPSFYVGSGINVQSPYQPPAAQYHDVLIADNFVHDVIGDGILFTGEAGPGYTSLSTNVRIQGNTVLHTAGDGIRVDGTDNELIDSNRVSGAGALGKIYNTADSTGGGAIGGIWPTIHRNGIIEYNEVDSTRCLPGDGQAFDNDDWLSGTTIFQYNYTKDNQGGFFQDCIGSPDNDDPAQKDYSIVRYNISQNDGFDTMNTPHLFLFAFRGGDSTYNNTFYNRPGGGFYIQGVAAYARNGPNTIENNIFYGTDACWNEASNNYSNNWYYFNWPQNGAKYTPPRRVFLKAIGPGNNYLPSNDPTASGHVADPCLFGKWGIGNLGFTAISDYRLCSTSPCLGAVKGFNIISNNGGFDFWGNQVYPAPRMGNIGADNSAYGVNKIKSWGF